MIELNKGWFTRDYYIIENENNNLSLKTRTLNIFQQALRHLLGFYSNTIFTKEDSDAIAKRYPADWKKIEQQVHDALFQKVFKIPKCTPPDPQLAPHLPPDEPYLTL